jgi:hypothetical protein
MEWIFHALIRCHQPMALIERTLAADKTIDPGKSKRRSVRLSCFLGDHPKAAIGYHFKTGHRETA